MRRALALGAVAPAVWGSTYLVTTELLPPDRPLTAAALRAAPAGLILMAYRPQLPRGRWLTRAAVLGALNVGLFFPLLFAAAYRLPGGVAATLGAVGPLLVMALAYALLSERPTSLRVLSGVAGAIGVALLVLSSRVSLDPVGVAAGVGATAAMALGTVLTRRWAEGMAPVTVTAWQLTAGGALLLPVALAVDGLPVPMTVGNLVGYGYLSLVGGALAYVLWFRAIARAAATSAAFLLLLSPVVATLLGLAVLDQSLTARQWIGFAVALTSVLVGASGFSRRAVRPEPTRPAQPWPHPEPVEPGQAPGRLLDKPSAQST